MDQSLVLTFATSNVHKVEEAREYLPEFNIVQHETDLVEIRSEDLEEIALYSLQSVSESVRRPLFVEDSGIFIHALGGFPGPISGYTHEKLGNDKVLSLLQGSEDRSAHFESVIALQIPEGDIITFHGKVDGSIAMEEMGSRGFDYDSIFIPEGEEKTIAQMTLSEKNEFSHRGKALKKMRNYLIGTDS